MRIAASHPPYEGFDLMFVSVHAVQFYRQESASLYRPHSNVATVKYLHIPQTESHALDS